MSLSERAKNIISFLNGFRKFIIMLVLVLVGIVFRVTDFISGAEMVDLLKHTAVAFMAANGVEHMMKATQEWVKGKIQKEIKEAKDD